MSYDYTETPASTQYQEPKKKKSCCLFALAGCGCLAILIIGGIVGVSIYFGHSLKGLAMTGAHIAEISIAVDKYCTENGKYPPAYTVDKDGKPLHSWRVLLLKYIDPKLYDEIRLDEPWDSDHNKQFASRMPLSYANATTKEEGKTNYQMIIGKKCISDGPNQRTVDEMREYANEIIVFVEATPSVNWMQPQDLSYDDLMANGIVAEGGAASGLTCPHKLFGFRFGCTGSSMRGTYVYSDMKGADAQMSGQNNITYQLLCARAAMPTNVGEYKPKEKPEEDKTEVKKEQEENQ